MKYRYDTRFIIIPNQRFEWTSIHQAKLSTQWKRSGLDGDNFREEWIKKHAINTARGWGEKMDDLGLHQHTELAGVIFSLRLRREKNNNIKREEANWSYSLIMILQWMSANYWPRDYVMLVKMCVCGMVVVMLLLVVVMLLVVRGIDGVVCVWMDWWMKMENKIGDDYDYYYYFTWRWGGWLVERTGRWVYNLIF